MLSNALGNMHASAMKRSGCITSASSIDLLESGHHPATNPMTTKIPKAVAAVSTHDIPTRAAI
jgi:hypothetical protein